MDYIQKPFTEEELQRFVRRALIVRDDRLKKRLKPRVHVMHPNETDRELAGEFYVPGGALVSEGHCWVSLAEDGTVKIGPDDFARKLIGRVDAIELPKIGSKVLAGQPVFSLIQEQREASFQSPLSGKVVKVNGALGESGEHVGNLSYGRNWVCVIEPADLDAELPGLKIGKSAVSYLQDEIERFRDFQRETANEEFSDPDFLTMGAFEQMDDDRWRIAVRTFFGS
jgi:glycine cleavage system H protein